MSIARNALALVIATSVTVLAYLLAAALVDWTVALALMVFVFVPVSVKIAKSVTGRDLNVLAGFTPDQ